MSGDPSVREKTKEAVMAAAKALHYTPNRAASALGKQTVIKLAVVYSPTTKLYYTTMEQGFRQCEEELFDYGLSLEYHTTTIPGWKPQEEILSQLLLRPDIDGIVLQPASQHKLDQAIDALVYAGKPVVTFGTDAPCSKRLFHVSCNAYQSGRIASQMLEKELHTPGPVYLVASETDQHQALERHRGFLERFQARCPDVPVKTLTPQSIDQYYSAVYDLVLREPIAGIFCSDAFTASVGAVLQSLGRPDIPLVGFDLTPESISLLQDEYIRVLLDQKPNVHSYIAAKLMFQFLSDGIQPDPIIHTPVYLYTSECISPAFETMPQPLSND